jgi:Flp pilus assembly protein TadG
MFAIASLTTALRGNRRRESRAGAAQAVRRWGAEERGSNLLEMAFVATFLFLFIAGIVDLGGAFQDYIVAINASREGARTYARLPCVSGNRTVLKSSVVTSAVGEAERSGLKLTASNVSLFPDPTSYCPANGAEIVVTVKVDYPTLMGVFWNAETLPIKAQTRMMFFGTDE